MTLSAVTLGYSCVSELYDMIAANMRSIGSISDFYIPGISGGECRCKTVPGEPLNIQMQESGAWVPSNA